jgi:hypothetical protein
MSELESKIQQLEREVALKKAYQSVQISFPKSAKLPEDVTQEVTQRLRDVAQKLALGTADKGDDTPTTLDLTSEEIQVLKMLAQSALKKTKITLPATTVADESASQVMQAPAEPKPVQEPRKGKIQLTENIRGEAKRYAVIDDEVYVPNPETVDAHGMVSAIHTRRGGSMKIPLDDIAFVS